jgi:hypothetical protein
MKLIDNPISINDIHNFNPEGYLDFKDLNINKELSFTDILTKLKSIINEDNNWYGETTILKECITNVRKITCRQLNRDNAMLIENKIHILLFKLLEYYQAYIEYNEGETAVIVSK